MLALIVLTAFSFLHDGNTQDVSRLALTQAVWSDQSLRIDRWAEGHLDVARYNGHYYSDKAPGMSFLAVPSYALLRVSGLADAEVERSGVWTWASFLWLIRLLTGGLGLVALLLLAGRVAEAIAPNTGAATASTLGLGTLILPLAATTFGHVVAAALGFGAFVAAWSGVRAPTGREFRFALSGLSAGLAVLVEYQTAVIALVLVLYVASRTLRGALTFVLAGVPSVLALAAYNAAAFGSPFRFSYEYVTDAFAEPQGEGFFGIGVPDPGALVQILLSSRGLLVQTPVLVLAAIGLALAWRAGSRAEAAVCAAVPLLFVLISAGYFAPMGGVSPGPRFVTPALPFLAVGLPLAFRRWPILTLVATTISVASMLLRSLTWSHLGPPEYETIWGALLSDSGRTSTLLGAFAAGLFASAALLLSARAVLSMYRGGLLPRSGSARGQVDRLS